jgi:hypothetical protein
MGNKDFVLVGKQKTDMERNDSLNRILSTGLW